MLIVEDGTGLPNADSYISVEDASAYFAAFGGDAWADLDEGEQEIALRRSTRDLDMLYGGQYQGSVLDHEQALLWPRTSFYDPNGRSVTGLPASLGQAVAELALLNIAGDATGPLQTVGNVKTSSVKVGDIEKSTEYFAASAASSAQLRKVNFLLRPLLKPGMGSMYVRLVRG